MTKEEFINLLYSELNFYDDIERDDVTEETDLTLFSNWDSLSRATVFNVVEHEIGKTLSHSDLKECKTIADLIKLSI